VKRIVSEQRAYKYDIFISYSHRDREWINASGLEPVAFNAALEALGCHDVVTVADGKCRYAVELMRRWVVSNREQSDSSANNILQTHP